VTTISHGIALAATLLLAAGPGVSMVAHATGGGPAHGAPGEAGTWTNAAKMGIGTSYEAYVDGSFADTATTDIVSKIWFSIAQGIVTEVAYGLIHENQVRDLQLLVTGPGFFDEERRDTAYSVDYLAVDDPATNRPAAPAFKILNTDRATPSATQSKSTSSPTPIGKPL
jgi:glucoamylase